jgi:hypothetical protein
MGQNWGVSITFAMDRCGSRTTKLKRGDSHARRRIVRQRIFSERFGDDVVQLRRRRTARLEYIVHHLGLTLGGRPAAVFGKRLMLPVSNDTLLRVVRRPDKYLQHRDMEVQPPDCRHVGGARDRALRPIEARRGNCYLWEPPRESPMPCVCGGLVGHGFVNLVEDRAQQCGRLPRPADTVSGSG